MGGRFGRREADKVRAFVEASLARCRGDGQLKFPDSVPASMVTPPLEPDDDGYVTWKPIASTVIDAELDGLEHEQGLSYPPLYRVFLKTIHFLELSERGVRFFEHPSDRWQEVLREHYHGHVGDRIRSLGLIPFGREVLMDAGSTCFDTNNRLPSGDCPVVFWDHEWVGTDKEVQPMFSSAKSMFRCLRFLDTQRLGIILHLEEFDPPEELVEKQRAITEFLALDPHGAGGPARDYWTSWGVRP